MSWLARFAHAASRWLPWGATGAIALVLADHRFAIGTAIACAATLIFAAVAMIDTSVPRS